MPSVSNIQPIAAKEERSPVSHDKGRAASLFARANSVAQADMLLKGTGQYEKWQSICQKNGTSSVLAEKVATDIVTRHTMLEQAKQNASGVDWGKFDALTQSIARNGIALYTSDQLAIAASSPSPSSKKHFPISQTLMLMDSTSGVQPLQSSKPSTAASQSLNLSV